MPLSARLARRAAALLAGAAALALSAAPGAASAAPFSPTGVWNAPLAADAPVDAKSSTYVAELRRQLTLASPWINTTQYSTPIYEVGPGVPTQKVVLDTAYSPLQQAWLNVPVPPNAKPAAGNDGHMVIHQPSTDTMWEFWKGAWRDGAWHARWGGRMTGASTNPGFYSGTLGSWGATATSLALAGGVITDEDLAAGRIDHALALAIPQTRAGVWSLPAQRTDGQVASANAIPEGARFRIAPNVNLDAIAMPRLTRMMAVAAQRYGIIIRDKGGAVTFYGEDPKSVGYNPWSGPTGAFGGKYPNQLLASFPWSKLTVVQTELRSKG